MSSTLPLHEIELIREVVLANGVSGVRDSGLPESFCAAFETAVVTIRGQMAKGDQLWQYRVIGSNGKAGGGSGLAIVREGKVVSYHQLIMT